MLKYHKYIWESFDKHPSGLYVLGRGLDSFEIEKQLVLEYSKRHQLVFVFGVSENDKQRIIWEAANSGIDFLPKDIEKDTGRKDRKQHYESNIVFFHNPGILAKDFLQNSIDPKRIEGFIINDAETVHKDPGLQLCLAYYRSANKTGFIKAFCEKCYYVSNLELTADLLWIRNIQMFPRFEINVKTSIQQCEVQIIDIPFKNVSSDGQMTDNNNESTFTPIVSNELVKIFDLLSALHRAFMDEYGSSLGITTEESLFLHRKTLEKKAMNDEQNKVLESVLFFRRAFFFLLHEDPIIFNEYLNNIQSRNSGPYHPLWYEFPQAASIFRSAHKYAEENIPNPKLQWIVHLISVLPKNKRILILAEGTGTIGMICGFLAGFTPKTAGIDINIPLENVAINDKNPNKNSDGSGKSNNNTTSNSQNDVNFDEEPLINPELFGILSEPIVLLQELHAQADVLEKFQPDIVIFWDMTLLALRRLEVYKSRYQKSVIAYQLSYVETRDIDVVKHAGQHEVNIFAHCIQSLKNISLPPLVPFSQGARPIIVDDREFRSSLPLGLLRAEFKVIPELLSVCDYVLSDDIVIERKAYTDFVGSLSSGRLLSQLQRMKSFYNTFCLLLEFSDVPDQFNAISAKGRNPAPMAKLATILYTFPEIKLIWARNNIEAGKTLRSLAMGTAEPSAAKAIAMGTSASISNNNANNNNNAAMTKDANSQDNCAADEQRQLKFLAEIKFLTAQHIDALSGACRNLKDLVLKNKLELMKIVDPVVGMRLFNLLHTPLKSVI